MAYCVECGTELEIGSHFCTNCGKKAEHEHATARAHEYSPTDRAPSPSLASLPASAPIPGGSRAGKNAARVAAIVALVGFVMPWISCQGLTGRETVSGLQLASHGAPGLWIVPISMLIALGVLMNKGKSLQERTTAAKALIGAGMASVVVMLYYYASLNGAGQKDELGLGAVMRQAFTIEMGAILSFLGSIGTAIGGFIHHQSAKPPEVGRGEDGESRSTSASG